MTITFNPLFDYKGIARDALQGLGLDEQYLQDTKEKPILADGFGSKPIENNNFEEGFGSTPINYGVDPGSEAIPDYVNGVAESLAQRQEELRQIISDYDSGKINVLQANVDVLGKTVVGSAFDVLSETASLALKGVSLLVPDAIEDPVKNTIKKSFDFLMNTEGGQEAIAALNKGVEAWGEYKLANPENARTVEAVVNTALLFAPIKTKRNSKPANTKVGGILVGKVEEAAGKQLTQSVDKRVASLLAPERTEDRIKDIVNIDRKGQILPKGESGVFGLTKVNENQFELDRNKLVSNIADIKAKDTIANTANIVRDHNKGKAEKLYNMLEMTGVRWNFPENTVAELTKMVQATLKDKIYLQADEATAKLVEGNLKVAMETIAKFPNTPAGLLRARQAFDKVLNEQLAGKAFDPKVINANNESLNAVRNAINDLIQARVVSSGVDVKKSLSEQHKLWNAQNILDIKAVNEGTNTFSRIIQNLNPLVDTQLLINRLIAVGGGMGSFAAAQLIGKPIAASAVFGGTAYAVTRGVMSLSAKKALALTLTSIDKAIKKSTNGEMIKQLRLDRAYIADLMKQPLTKEDESFAVN
jgi:hypothetical protein